MDSPVTYRTWCGGSGPGARFTLSSLRKICYLLLLIPIIREESVQNGCVCAALRATYMQAGKQVAASIRGNSAHQDRIYEAFYLQLMWCEGSPHCCCVGVLYCEKK